MTTKTALDSAAKQVEFSLTPDAALFLYKFLQDVSIKGRSENFARQAAISALLTAGLQVSKCLEHSEALSRRRLELQAKPVPNYEPSDFLFASQTAENYWSEFYGSVNALHGFVQLKVRLNESWLAYVEGLLDAQVWDGIQCKLYVAVIANIGAAKEYKEPVPQELKQ